MGRSDCAPLNVYSGSTPSTDANQPKEQHDTARWLYRQELVDCGKAATGRCRTCTNGPSHGPYWYAYQWSDGKTHKRYVGRSLPEAASGANPGAGSVLPPAERAAVHHPGPRRP
jgi:hypothetical protein